MRATENFLRLIWPSVGKKAIVGIKDKQVRHHWFDPEQIQEAAQKAEELSNAGTDVYMAVAGFDSASREAEHAVALKSLYLDIDCGEGKEYQTQTQARAALDAFLASSGLPTPLVLSSGYGIHVYWPLVEELNRETWLTLAFALKALCKTHSLNADHKITSDAARILRPIGTRNFKNGTPRRVEALAAGNICTTEDLRAVLLKTSESIFADLAKQQVAQATAQSTNFTTEYPEVALDDILPRCATLRWAYENQNEVREPLWYAAIGLANYCKDAVETAHRLSSRHPEYDRANTERKQSHWRLSVSGPPTCDNFRQCPGSRCGTCNERVTSPVQLGLPHNTSPTCSIQLGNTTTQKFANPWLQVTSNGMSIKDVGKPAPDGTMPPPSWTKLTDCGLQPLLNLRLADQSTGVPANYVWMEAHDENYTPLQNFLVPSVSINNSALFAADCARNGIINELETSPTAFRTFAKIMRTWVRKLTKDQGAVLTFRSFGWVGPDGLGKPKNSFFLGNKLYTPDGVMDTPLLPMLEIYQNDMVGSGTLGAWAAAMDGYNTPGMESYMFATWTAWGAPLMGFTNSGNLASISMTAVRITS